MKNFNIDSKRIFNAIEGIANDGIGKLFGGIDEIQEIEAVDIIGFNIRVVVNLLVLFVDNLNRNNLKSRERKIITYIHNFIFVRNMK